jgi:hypothetical protein
MKKFLHRLATPLVAITVIAGCYWMARFPYISASDRMKLASRFKFDRLPLAEVTNHPPYKYDNVVSPAVEHGWTLAMGVADLDGDQLPEVYLANDFGPDRLLHNESTPGHLKFRLLEGRRRFTDPKSSVLGQDSLKGMGVDFADVNGDGLLDIYVSNIADTFALTESHLLGRARASSTT